MAQVTPEVLAEIIALPEPLRSQRMALLGITPEDIARAQGLALPFQAKGLETAPAIGTEFPGGKKESFAPVEAGLIEALSPGNRTTLAIRLAGEGLDAKKAEQKLIKQLKKAIPQSTPETRPFIEAAAKKVILEFGQTLTGDIQVRPPTATTAVPPPETPSGTLVPSIKNVQIPPSPAIGPATVQARTPNVAPSVTPFPELLGKPKVTAQILGQGPLAQGEPDGEEQEASRLTDDEKRDLFIALGALGQRLSERDKLPSPPRGSAPSTRGIGSRNVVKSPFSAAQSQRQSGPLPSLKRLVGA